MVRLSDEAYLRQVDFLARALCEGAAGQGWLTYLPDDTTEIPLRRAVNELARNLRHRHHPATDVWTATDGFDSAGTALLR